jgi:hypothetical protein
LQAPKQSKTAVPAARTASRNIEGSASLHSTPTNAARLETDLE